MCNASNYNNEGYDAKGLIPGHAYSVEGFQLINDSQLIRLRNPWGEGVWHGKWSADWINEHRRDFNNDQLQRLKSLTNKDNDDGSFWMDWDDFVEKFDNFTVCHLADPNDYEKRARGIFRYRNLSYYNLSLLDYTHVK